MGACGKQDGAAGFTVVELVTVMLLLSILGVVVLSRMISPEAFAPRIVAAALVAESRFAQQIAASRHDAVVTLTVDRSGSDWRFRVATDVDGVIRTQRVTAGNTTLQAASGAAVGAIGPGTSLVVQFGHTGDLAAVSIGASAGDADAGIGLTVNGDSTRQACIYNSGYANEDACG